MGLAVGVPVALGASRLLGSLLYGVSPTDPVVFVVMPAIVLAVAMLACYVPARRAMRMDPLTALRRHDDGKMQVAGRQVRVSGGPSRSGSSRHYVRALWLRLPPTGNDFAIHHVTTIPTTSLSISSDV